MIEGVTIRDLIVRTDERGSLTELLSVNMGDEDLCHVYVAMARPGVVKGFHAHLLQTDRFVCLQGVAKIGMVDLRGDVFTRTSIMQHDDWSYLGSPAYVPDGKRDWRQWLAHNAPDDREERDNWWIEMLGPGDRSTFFRKNSIILDSERPQMLTIPPGVAHGQMALESRSVILNAPTVPFNREAPDELRMPADSFGFVWPVENK